MKKYCFREATPLMEFIENNENNIVGHRVTNCCLWDCVGEHIWTDVPPLFEIDGEYYLQVDYFCLSDMSLTIYSKEEAGEKSHQYGLCIKEELEKNKEDMKTRHHYTEEMIIGERIKWIEVVPFSDEFICDEVTGETRPEGGDYFSNIRVCFENGSVLCLLGDTYGYTIIWLD